MSLNRYWELDLFAYALVLIIVAGVCSVLVAWWNDRKKWRAIAPYYGKTYDASVDAKVRPNVRRA